MSLCSMTGYGRGVATTDGLRVEAELSSVNRKQLDIGIGLPKALGSFESRIADLVQRFVSRGRITGDIVVTRSSRQKARSIRVDKELAGAYVRVLRDNIRSLGLKDDLSGSLLLTLPDVLVYESRLEDPEVLWSVMESALTRALKQLVRMRKKEGAALQRELTVMVGRLRKYLATIRRRAPGVAESYRKNLLTRLQQAGLAASNQPDERLLKEIAIFADRSDITEEITRLDSHFSQAGDLLGKSEAVGRALDFLVQEMLREINTIGSKANDGLIARQVVSFKAELERIREQVQNVE